MNGTAIPPQNTGRISVNVGRTLTDLSDEENARTCAWEYRRAFDTVGASRPFKLAEWALKWGDAIIQETT